MQDSPSVSQENLAFTARNATAEVDADEELSSSHLQPLLDADDDGDAAGAKSEKRSPLKSPNKKSSGDGYSAVGDETVDDEELLQDEINTFGKKTFADKVKAASNLSLDSYDRSKNPFFADGS